MFLVLKRATDALNWPSEIGAWRGISIPLTGDPVHRFVITADGSLSIKQVGPDNTGLYSCTVRMGSNEQSVSAWLRIIEKPSMPQNVYADLLNETVPARVRVSWREGFDGNSPLIKHIVQMRSIGPTGLWSDWESVVDNVPSELCCSTLVDNLKPSSIIEFRVVAVNRHGAGKPSLPSNNVTMPQQPPAAAPRNVAASARSWSSIMVQWQPPPSEQWNGDILGYIIRYRLANYASLPWLEKNISNGHARNAPLEHLITWREYEIQVAAYNDRGMGVFSKPLYVTTLEGVPTQAPLDVKVSVINATAIAVSFTPPDQQMIPGVNQGYKVELWKGEVTPTTLYRQVRVLPNEQNITVVIGELEKFGHYNVTVLCFTSPGDGPRSAPVETTTMEDLPGAVESVNFDAVLSNSAVVMWNPPSEPNGIITKYSVRFWEDANPSNKKTVKVKSDTLNVTINELKASTRYTVDVQAWTKIGAGPKTEGRFESGVPPELPGRPSSLVVSDIGARSAVLQFIPGFDGHTLIRKWIVEARIASSSIFVVIFNTSAPKARSFTVEGLRPYTKYQLRLIAENIRGRGAPSEPSHEFETKQAAPEIAPDKLFAEPRSSTSISVSWTPLHPTQWNGEPRGYLILFRNNDREQWSEVRTSNIKENDFVLSELRPFTNYEIRLVAENSLGRSELSKKVFAKTYEDIPSGAPTNVHAIVDDRRRALISWNRVEERSANGIILGYKVRIVPEEERLRAQFMRTADISGSTVLKTAFSQLRAFTAYRVFVAAYTVVGKGPENIAPPILQTGEDTPGEPSGVAFSYVSESEVRLKWMPPLNPNGRILNYEVAYWKPAMKQDALKILLPFNVFGFSATGLQPRTRYLFGVSAESSIGWGPQAVVAVVTTLQRAPPPLPPIPRHNEARAQSSNEICLVWTHPTLPPGEEDISPVRSLDVEYQASDGQWMPLANSIPGSVDEVTIDGLRPNTAYRARIRLVCDFAQSGWSMESPWIRTLEAPPSSPPLSVQVSPYESSALLLQWSPPSRNNWNSDTIGYRILYRPYPSNETLNSEEVAAAKEDLPKMQHIVRKLLSFRHYIVQMQTFNEQGSSEPSAPLFVYVGYSIPKRRVVNVIAEPLSSTSIAVRWDPWIELSDDVISGFKIRYTPIIPVLEGEENLEEVVVSENNSATVTDLRKFTEYQVNGYDDQVVSRLLANVSDETPVLETTYLLLHLPIVLLLSETRQVISVAAYNRAGEGEASAIRVTTMEDRPGTVGRLTFSDILLDSVNVSWTPPSEPNGIIQAYVINYKTYKLREEFKKEIQEKTTATYLLAENLEENVTYFFSVRAETLAGYGDEVVGNITTGPNPGCPDAPSKPFLIPGQMSVTLEWEDGPIGVSPISGHIVQAKRIARAKDLMRNDDLSAERSRRAMGTDGLVSHVLGDWVTIAKVQDEKPRHEVEYRVLEPSSLYVFRVFATNSVGVGYASAESEQLHVPSVLPEEPFFTKWWFIVMIAMLTSVVIVVVVALLCVTGSRYKYGKRNSIDSLQLADGGIVSYELRTSKRRNLHHSRNDLPGRPNTNTSWISDAREPPAYGSIVDVDANDRAATSIYGTLATDVIPQSGGGGSSNLVTMGIGRHLSSNAFVNRDSALDDFSADGESAEDESERNERETSIAQHYEHEDAYRSTWRKARAEAMAEATPSACASANNCSRPASSESNRSELLMITTARSSNPSSVIGGFSSFV
ncbi:unnamed protein product [Toxocara canis]|uniref:Protein sidekick-2 n=1 Tax=Toxocara canis TaxID=6265 RepID=A0A183UJ46_TOXCA|nr:unnamed protein product [Toxocara canis]